jgi:hypothetical protein
VSPILALVRGVVVVDLDLLVKHFPGRLAGGDLDAMTLVLEREGVQSFCDSYDQLLDCIEGKLGAFASAGSGQPT